MAFVPLSLQTIFDGGYAVLDARLYAYDADTTTPRTLFRSSALDPTFPHPFPVRTDGSGRFPPMWTGVGNYDIRITDADGAVMAEIVGLQGDPTPTGGGTTLEPLRQIPTGAVLAIHSAGRRAGWVRANGATIGSAASAGVERADDDCYALFLLLWDDPRRVVAGGRGQAAQDDWDAAKTIELPDLQGRFVMGALNMGNASTSSGRLDGGKLSDDGAVLGATGGEAGHALTEAELAQHGHGISVDVAPGGRHTPSGTIGQGGQHNHQIYYEARSIYGSGGSGAVSSVGNSQIGQSPGFTEITDPHTHTFSGNEVPDHDHGVTASLASAGSSQAHNTLPPFGVATIYIKL
ncbi:hypothetical protein [Methylobacterium variabile]|jgi:microcystin-dependent protein|uniref:hypothetical protein n=1 Tax=Methylobacterium variabile TaxID=298794 RepID=UPI000A70B7A9|nr:hypothetical protein [Methylobacterium variabile]